MLEREKLIFKREFLKHYKLYPKDKLNDILNNTKFVIGDFDGYAGFCYVKENRIDINKKYPNAIYHELLHRLSIKKHNTGYCGLYSYSKNIGYGLDEGYTERLTEEYFDKYKLTIDAYENEKYLSMIIEKIVGKKLMELIYFNSGYKVLIKILSQYKSEEDIITLLKDIDKYNELLDSTLDMDDIPRKSKIRIYLQEVKLYQELKSLYISFLTKKYKDNSLIELKTKELEEYMTNKVFNYINPDIKIKWLRKSK